MTAELASSLIILAAVVIGVGAASYAAFRIRRKAREISQAAFGTDNLGEGLARAQYEHENTPRSLSSATSIYLPQIKRDFPQFNYDDMKRRCANVVTSYFHAVDQMDASLLSEGSPELKESLRLRISMLHDVHQSEQFDKIKVHQVEIGRYFKSAGRCTVVFLCSFQSKHALLDGEGNVLKGSQEAWEQSRARVELVYVQDIDKGNDRATSIGLNCPNCGAPVSTLGQKTCSYCGAGIIEVNIHAWTFHSVTED